MPGARSAGTRTPGSRSERRFPVTLLIGLLLLAGGLGILGWAGWQYLGTNIVAHRDAHRTTAAIEQQWKQAPAAGKPGSASSGTAAGAAVPTTVGSGMAIIRIPDLGASWEYPVIAGTTPDVLARGVGWYTGTALPGQVGNFAVAAHRVTHGEPFRHLLELHKGAKVVVETRDHVYTYVLDNDPSQLTVQDTAGWVLDPVPGRPSQKPTRALITLTTCQDLFHSSDRSVAFGHLVDQRAK